MSKRRHRRGGQPRPKPPQGNRYRPMATGPPRLGPPSPPPPPNMNRLVDAVLSAYRQATAGDDSAHRAVATEAWASSLARSMLPSPVPELPLPGREPTPPAAPIEMWDDLADALADRPRADLDASAALAGLAAVAPDPEGRRFRQRWEERRQSPLPTWLAAIGASEAVDALCVHHVQGDGVNVMIGYDHPVAPHVLGVYIDHNLGALAKDVLIGPPLAEAAARFPADREHGFTHEPLSLADARARIEAALWVTDHTLDPPVDEDLEELRPLLDRRLGPLPAGGEEPAEQVMITDDERISLVVDFRASPWAGQVPDDRYPDLNEILATWLEHATGYTRGGPLRVSGVLVELFLADYLPRKVVAARAYLDQVPDVVRAWLRFAADRTGLNQRWLDDALSAVGRHAPTMFERADDPEYFGLAKSFAADVGLDHDDLDVAFDLDDLDDLNDGDDDEGPWVGADPGPIDLGGFDWSGVPEGEVGRVATIALGASRQAARHLGTLYSRPAAALAVELGRLDPSPLPNTQIRSWPGAIVWLLCEENDLFRLITCDFSRKLLAERLGMSPQTYAKKAALLRNRLGIQPGDPRTTVDIDGDYW